jgi:glycosyltransferase involved in cell wall biosynthesis
MISVIIPAHNEGRVINRCLEHITRGAKPGELDVVVVCNGCTDDTAEIARRFSDSIRVIETGVASKPGALNLGDDATDVFPRAYVDADVLISIDSIRRVAAVLESGEALAAAPRIDVSLQGTSWPVRAFYRVWTELPYFHTGMIGSGVYALSREGRSRFGSFPELFGEDSYVRLLFSPEERMSLASCSFTIFAPSQLSVLLRIKARSRLGGLQLEKEFPDLARKDEKPYRSAMPRLLKKPSLWPALPVYFLIVLITRRRAAKRFREGEGNLGKWDRDDSSRARAQGSEPSKP